MSNTMSNLPHDASVSAEVNVQTAFVMMYDESGKAVQVASSDEPHFLSKGYTRVKLDPAAALQEFNAMLDAAKQAVEAYANGVMSDGKIDHSSEGNRFAAQVAMVEFEHAWHSLQRSIDGTLPSQEAEPVTLTHASGQTVSVDPGQVELYNAQGFEVKK